MKPEYYNYFSRREKLPDDPEKGIIFALIDDGKILLERRLNGVAEGMVIVPGGRRKVDESKDFALSRELLEECNISPSKYKLIGEIKNINIPSSDVKELAVFLVLGYEGVVENKEKKSIHIWVEINLAEETCNHPLSQQILKMVFMALLDD